MLRAGSYRGRVGTFVTGKPPKSPEQPVVLGYVQLPAPVTPQQPEHAQPNPLELQRRRTL